MLRQEEAWAQEEEGGGTKGDGGEPESCFQISFRLLSYAIMMNLGLIPSAPDQLPLPTLPTIPTPPAALLTAALLALCKAGTNFWFAGQAKCLILKRYRSSNLRGQCSRRGRLEREEGNVQKCHKARAHKQLESGGRRKAASDNKAKRRI